MRGSTVQNSSTTDFHVADGPDIDRETAYAMHGGILFIQATIVLLVGLLLPIPPGAIDVLLAVNFIFTIMLLVVVLLARKAAEITSVPLVVIFITLLRLGTNVAAAKSVLLIASGGRIIDWCGTSIYYGFISVVITLLLVFLMGVLITKAIVFIRHKAVDYLVATIPARRAILEAQLHDGTLAADQLVHAREHIDRQTRFFTGMASTSSLLLCDCIIMLIITIATIFGATVLGILNISTSMAGTQHYSPPALAIALITAVPAAIVVLALRVLITKPFFAAIKPQSPVSPKKIYVSSKVVESVPNKNTPVIHKQAIAVNTDEAAQKIRGTHPLDCQPVRNNDYYDTILATVGDKEKAAILLAGQTVAHLPLTIAVELVVRIVQLNKKCLLIDMDPARHAVATAFDIDSSSMQGKAVPTGIENLWISPADNPDNPMAIKLSRKVANALKTLEYVVIYAPNATIETVQQQLVGTSNAAIIFGTEKETLSLEQFSKTLLRQGCRTISEQDICMRVI
jgi:hypothetical protein